MTEWLVPALLVLNLALVIWLALRRTEIPDPEPALQALAASNRLDAERLQREMQDAARGTRQELAGTLTLFQQLSLIHI